MDFHINSPFYIISCWTELWNYLKINILLYNTTCHNRQGIMKLFACYRIFIIEHMLAPLKMLDKKYFDGDSRIHDYSAVSSFMGLFQYEVIQGYGGKLPTMYGSVIRTRKLLQVRHMNSLLNHNSPLLGKSGRLPIRTAEFPALTSADQLYCCKGNIFNSTCIYCTHL